MVGASVLGASVVGASVLGASVLGESVLGASVLGASVLGASVLGASLDGATVVSAFSESSMIEVFGCCSFGGIIPRDAHISEPFGVNPFVHLCGTPGAAVSFSSSLHSSS